MALFKSFFIGGFECSTHYGPHRRRLDLLAATGHDRFVMLDYARLREYGIYTVREGVRWHRVETTPGQYTFDEVRNHIRAAEDMEIQVIWDLLHFGYPDDIDPFDSAFIYLYTWQGYPLLRGQASYPIVLKPLEERTEHSHC